MSTRPWRAISNMRSPCGACSSSALFFGKARRPPVGEASIVSPTQSSRMRDVGSPWRRSAGQISPVSWQANAVIMSTLNGVPLIAASMAGWNWLLNQNASWALGMSHLPSLGEMVRRRPARIEKC